MAGEQSAGSSLLLILFPEAGRISEIPVLVNTTEKVTLLKFSILVFGSVSVSGSQTNLTSDFLAFRLTAERQECSRTRQFSPKEPLPRG
jgi:hypothetical protein